MKVSMKYGSHLPVLIRLVEMTDGPILELGIGMYSTPFLHYACLPTKRSLVSYENEATWIRYFRDCRTDFHSLDHVDNWDNLEINQLWDIAFIDADNLPGPTRKNLAAKLSNFAKYVVLHDTDPENDVHYNYSEVYPLFKHRYDYTTASPNTTVLSNFVSLDNLNLL